MSIQKGSEKISIEVRKKLRKLENLVKAILSFYSCQLPLPSQPVNMDCVTVLKYRDNNKLFCG